MAAPEHRHGTGARLVARRAGIDTYQAAVVYMRADCEVCKAEGYEAQVLEGVPRPASSPESIDYSQLPATGHVLHMYFNEVGMHSARFSMDYVPRVNLSANLIGPGGQENVYDETIYYGADSSGNKTWSVPANPTHRWSSFGELVAKPQEVARSYDEAIEALALKIAQNIRQQFRPASARISAAH